ncbi:hypothetical protein [Stenotrophomonas geniculata]|uniref:hypothetical protein n=2 Tax=Stenotrophomonas TaxID=40323 RepID=UPI000A520FC5|nr:hypothetical protein [Stenotrophomonas geniculata]MBH1851437.1 hypothetical protein [Stenotrophomonas maltophilia]
MRLPMLVVLVFALMVCSGCGSSKSNIVYLKGERKAVLTAPAFFMDRQGDLYPPFDIKVDVDRNEFISSSDGVRGRSSTKATLRAYYQRHFEKGDESWTALLDATGVDPSGVFDQDWDRIQVALRKRVIDCFKVPVGQEVVLVIHGFNNDHGTANTWMSGFDSEVKRRRPGAQVVRMYWDGLRGNAMGIGIWGEAQFNSPRVGQSLRRILNQVDSGTKLRIFTHSLGGSVVANALGNGGGAYNGFSQSWNAVVKERAGAMDGEWRIPRNLTDLRVAMLVPAQPPTAFNDFSLVTEGMQQGVIPSRIVVGTSEGDIATSKFILHCGTWRTGNTCMPLRQQKTCRELRKVFDQPGEASRVRLVNFPRPIKWYHDHGVPSYVEDRTEWNELLEQLFEDDPPIPKSTVRFCPSVAS